MTTEQIQKLKPGDELQATKLMPRTQYSRPNMIGKFTSYNRHNKSLRVRVADGVRTYHPAFWETL